MEAFIEYEAESPFGDLFFPSACEQNGLDIKTPTTRPSGGESKEEDLFNVGMVPDLFNTWFESPVDLLDLLEDPDDSLNSSSEYYSIMDTPVMDKTGQDTKQTDASAILDMLAAGLDVDLARVPGFETPVLSPTSLSSEDVDSILASEPSSPVTDLSSGLSWPQSPTGDPHMSPLPRPESELTLEGDEEVNDPSWSPYNIEQAPTTSSSSTPQRRSRKRKAPQFGNVDKTTERKLRKKQQNKDAAIRYRQKKRAEQDQVGGEVQALEEKNKKLKDSVSSIQNEVQYLKDLLLEVYTARGINLPILLKKK